MVSPCISVGGDQSVRCAPKMRDMRGRVAFLCLVAIRAVVALPAPDGAACDPIGPRKDCGEPSHVSHGGSIRFSVFKYIGERGSNLYAMLKSFALVMPRHQRCFYMKVFSFTFQSMPNSLGQQKTGPVSVLRYDSSGLPLRKEDLVFQVIVLRTLLCCVGYLGIVKKACQAKGCCWLPLVDLDDPIRGGPQLEQPACFYTNTFPSVYRATDVNKTKTSTEVSLPHSAPHLLTSMHAFIPKLG